MISPINCNRFYLLLRLSCQPCHQHHAFLFVPAKNFLLSALTLSATDEKYKKLIRTSGKANGICRLDFQRTFKKTLFAYK